MMEVQSGQDLSLGFKRPVLGITLRERERAEDASTRRYEGCWGGGPAVMSGEDREVNKM